MVSSGRKSDGVIGWVLLTITQMLAGSVVECAALSKEGRAAGPGFGPGFPSSVVEVLSDPGSDSTFASLDGSVPPPEATVTPPITSAVVRAATVTASVFLTPA